MKIFMSVPGSSKSSPFLERFRKHSLPYFLIVPTVIFLILFSLYPFISGIWYSFTSIGWIKDTAKFVWLSNYSQILIGNVGIAQWFKLAVVQTIYWTVIGVAGMFFMAMATALILNEKFPGRFLFRTAVLISDRDAHRNPGPHLAMDVRPILRHRQPLFIQVRADPQRQHDLGGSSKFQHLAPDRRLDLARLSFHGTDAAFGYARHSDGALRGSQSRWSQRATALLAYHSNPDAHDNCDHPNPKHHLDLEFLRYHHGDGGELGTDRL